MFQRESLWYKCIQMYWFKWLIVTLRVRTSVIPRSKRNLSLDAFGVRRLFRGARDCSRNGSVTSFKVKAASRDRRRAPPRGRRNGGFARLRWKEQHAILLQQTLFGFKKPPLSDLIFSVQLTYMGNPWVISSCYQRLRCFDQLGQPTTEGREIPWHHDFHISRPWRRQLVLSSFLSVHSGLPRLFTHQADLMMPFEEFFCCLYRECITLLKKQKFSQISLYKEGWFVMFIIFLLCFCQLSSLLGTPSPFAKFCQEVSDLNLHRPATEAGKAYDASCLVVKSMGSMNHLYKL